MIGRPISPPNSRPRSTRNWRACHATTWRPARRVISKDLSRRRRLRRDQIRNRCAGLRAGADAGDLCRRQRLPQRAAAKRGRILRRRALLDVGAGPGTASWAAARGLSLTQLASRCSTPIQALRALALDLARRQHAPWRLALRARRGPRRARQGRDGRSRHRELSDRRTRRGRAHSRSQKLCGPRPATRSSSSNPARPRAMHASLPLRGQLIAVGAHVAAPCPHDAKCPLTPPDWCHFSQRLARSRAHKQVKGADAAVRGRAVFLCRADAKAGSSSAHPACWRSPRSARPKFRPGSARRTVSALAKVPRRDKAAYAKRPALALGRCGHGKKLMLSTAWPLNFAPLAAD